MLKELVLAIFLGVFIGFGITGSFLGIKKIAQKQLTAPKITVPTPAPKTNGEVTLTIPTQNPTPSIQPPSGGLIVTSPQNDTISTTEEITVSGQCLASSIILIQNQKDDNLSTCTNTGDFEIKIKLNSGLNDLKLTSISNDATSSVNLSIIYSNVKF